MNTSTQVLKAATPNLEIGYEQMGPESGKPMLLLHGWPYDPRCYDGVRLSFAQAGYRVIVPYARGFGTTRFLHQDTPRSAQQAALGKDVVDLLDALKIEKAILVGYDWGGRAGCVAAALWPERVQALVSCTGYTIQNRADNANKASNIESLRKSWYRWYFNTPMGAHGLPENRDALTQALWKEWSPKTPFDAVAFGRTAASFENPDWVDITLSCYRDYYANGPTDPAYKDLEKRLAQKPPISVPTLVLHGDSDGLYPTSVSAGQDSSFTNRYERHLLANVGHCPPADGPEAFISAVLKFLTT